MTKAVWKYNLKSDDMIIRVPEGAKFLMVREQGENVCIWAEVDPTRPEVIRTLAVYPTGSKLPDEPGTYLGTALLAGGSLVFHVYEPVPVLGGS